MPTADYLVRAARARDLGALVALGKLTGPGFTSLSISDEMLADRLALSEASFAGPVSTPDAERYILVLEHAPSGAVVGLAQVKAIVGRAQPFFNFRVLQIAAASAPAQRRYDMDVLILVNECTGCSEVGSLFVRPEHRVAGLGRLLAQARYLLIAAAPHRFANHIVSELRGVATPDGMSPFWEHLGRYFFRMSFSEADHLSATTDNQFILDLMPKYPIYVDLLPLEARAVIGKCHPEGEGARRLLEGEGFVYANVIDIFDGGPLLSAPRDTIRTVKQARRLRVRSGALGAGAPVCLIAAADVAAFRCVSAPARFDGDELTAPPDALQRLGLGDGEEALVWTAP